MTLSILKSQVPEDFDKQVEDYRQAMLKHRFTKNAAAPTAPSIIENAVKRVNQGKGKPDDFVTDYKIVDDTPPPPSLEDRKRELLRQVAEKEQELIAKHCLTPGKWRLLNLQIGDIQLNKQSADDKELIAQHLMLTERLKDIQYWAASQQADIEDLNKRTISAYKMREFEPNW